MWRAICTCSGPQSMLGPSNGRSLSFAQPLSSQQPAAPEKQLPAKSGGQSAGVGSVGPRPASAVSRSGAAAETAVVSHSSPPPVQGPAAEGWKVTITFRGALLFEIIGFIGGCCLSGLP